MQQISANKVKHVLIYLTFRHFIRILVHNIDVHLLLNIICVFLTIQICMTKFSFLSDLSIQVFNI